MNKYLIALLLFITASIPSFSQEKEPALVFVGAGVFNIVKYPKLPQLQLEYVFSEGYYKTYPFTIRPMIGITANSRYGNFTYGGVRFDIFASKKIVFTPSFAPGFYFKGKGKDLHFPLEFRSSMEMAYVLDNKMRLGAQFYHISNASLGKKNPGVESLIFFVAIPL